MKLPNAHLAIAEEEKILDYLLNAAHPDNGGKAGFFLGLGFSRNNWQTMAAAFQKIAEHDSIAKSMASSHGRKYVVDGEIETPSGKTPLVRTIWIIDAGFNAPRLVTAYPQEQ